MNSEKTPKKTKSSALDHPYEKVVFTITGMTCTACSSAITRALEQTQGVGSVIVNFISGKSIVHYNAQIITPTQLQESIKKLGYKARTTCELDVNQLKKQYHQEKNELVVSLVAGTLLFMVSMLPMLFPSLFFTHTPWQWQVMLQIALLLPILVVGRLIFIKGAVNLFRLTPNMDSLIAMSSTAALIYSLLNVSILWKTIPAHLHHSEHHWYFETVGVIIALVKLGKHMEAVSKNRANQSLDKLLQMAPATALLMNGDQVSEVPLEQIKVEDILMVKAGMLLGVDAVIISGEGSLDEALLTGESLPLYKETGASVIAGSLNTAGVFLCRVTKVGGQTTLSKLTRLIEEAQLTKAPISRLADKISGIFVPIVMLIAIASAVAWGVGTGDVNFAFNIFMAVLVVACPCALGLATPTAIVVAINRAASMGILIKNGTALESAGKTKSVVFDKTGTLTEGKPKLLKLVIEKTISLDHDHFLQLIASVESLSEHPLAQAIVQAAKEKHLKLLPVAHFKSSLGEGISALVNDIPVSIGYGLAHQAKQVSNNTQEQIKKYAKAGEMGIPILINNEYAGLAILADSLKQSSKKAVDQLKDLEVRPIMLTGDHAASAANMAGQLGIENVLANTKPYEKVAYIQQLQQRYGTLMMVGDGINDSAALSYADVGIAVGSAVDISIEVADMVLMHDDMCLIATTIKLSRATLRIIKQNLFWAFIYNGLGVPVAAGLLYLFGGPLFNPMLAAFFMAFSSVSVITNALRLKNIKL
jgi:Cu+-exporting ATPase